MLNNPLELLKFVQGKTRNESEALNMLAALADAPGEDFEAPIKLPTQNEIPLFKVGTDDTGSILAGYDHGEPAPVIGSEESAKLTIGDLLVGDM